MKLMNVMKAGLAVAITASLAISVCFAQQATKKTTVKKKEPKMVTTASGLKYQDLVVGKGDCPKKGQAVTVHYVGTLENGKKFDSSRDRGEAFTFTIGMGQVIKGWDEGVISMKAGGRRKLIIPAALGYGNRGAGPDIGPGATLIFDVELISFK